MEEFIITEEITIEVSVLIQNNFYSESYVKNKAKGILENFIEENNIYPPSIKNLKSSAMELAMLSPKKRVGIKIEFTARRRNEDDDERERIEYWISNLSDGGLH